VQSLGRLVVLAEEFRLSSAAQQLLDRFLVGYPHKGTHHRPQCETVTLYCSGEVSDDLFTGRAADFGLKRAEDPTAAAGQADAVLVVPKGAGHEAATGLVDAVLDGARARSKTFVYGPLADSAERARRVAEAANGKDIALMAGTYMPTTWRLPVVDVELGTPLREALMVVVGEPGEAELLGVDGLLPIVERRGSREGQGGEAGVASVRAFTGDEVWRAQAEGVFSAKLMASAISRTDTPQGDPVRDGRTQDLVGLGLVPKLAREPIAYVVEHRDGLRSTILVFNGVVDDINFAVETASGEIVSAQLYRPPAPNAHYWSTLAQTVEEYLASGRSPWPVERSVLTAGLLDALKRARNQTGEPIETPNLAVAYDAREHSAFVKI
jgi:hypothetical protein